MPTQQEVVESWKTVSDVYDCSTTNYSRLLRSKTICGTLSYRDRVFIAAYCYYNGVDPNLLEEALHLNANATAIKICKIIDLYNYWNGIRTTQEEATRRRSRYYTYSVYHRSFVTLNGDKYTLRRYNQ